MRFADTNEVQTNATINAINKVAVRNNKTQLTDGLRFLGLPSELRHIVYTMIAQEMAPIRYFINSPACQKLRGGTTPIGGNAMLLVNHQTNSELAQVMSNHRPRKFIIDGPQHFEIGPSIFQDIPPLYEIRRCELEFRSYHTISDTAMDNIRTFLRNMINLETVQITWKFGLSQFSVPRRAESRQYLTDHVEVHQIFVCDSWKALNDMESLRHFCTTYDGNTYCYGRKKENGVWIPRMVYNYTPYSTKQAF